MDLQIVGGAYEGRADAASAQVCINWMVETLRGEGETRALVGTPGLELRSSLGTQIRGMHVFGDELFVVADENVYSVDSDGTATSVGTMDTDTGLVSMSDNGRDKGGQMVIADGTDLYVYDPTLSVPLIKNTDALFTAAATTTFIDGYIVFNRPGTDEYHLTALNNALAIFGNAQAEGAPDNIVRVFADHRELWLFGELTTEVHYNSGNADFPFQRFQGGFTHQGCAAPYSVARFDNTLMWLSKNTRGEGMIVQATGGYRAKVVSPQEINGAIKRMGKIDDAIAFSYQLEGHEMYQITFPSGDRTFVFDASENEWHERASQTGDGMQGRHLGTHHAFAYDKHFIGGYDGQLYETSFEYLDDAGERIIRDRVGRHVRGELQSILLREVEALFETGTGDDDTPATVELAYSKDRGHTWSSFLTRTLGTAGQHPRAVWRKMGDARNWTFRIRVSDRVKWVLVSLYGR